MPSKIEHLSDEPPSSVNPYGVLGLEKDATQDQIKTAYRKAALKHHPDKAEDKDTAHIKFQEIAFAYAILSDERRRKRYDHTGRTEELLDLEDDEFDWVSYYKAQFEDVISSESIEKFKQEYKGSDEEKRHLLAAYTESKGNMDAIYDNVLLSNPLQDDERFRSILDKAINDGDIIVYKKYTGESEKSKQRRLDAARKEGKEAEEYAKELGVHDKLFGNGGSKKGGKKADKKGDADQSGLAALIQQRQKSREQNFFDHLEAKYAPKGRKRGVPEDEPPEEAFEKTASRKKSKASKPKAAEAAEGSRKSTRIKT